MKVHPFKISKPIGTAIVYQEDRVPIFYNKFHQHEEMQLSFILQGEGTVLVGDSVHHYEAGDFIIIGGQLPHVFKSEPQNTQESRMYSLFFHPQAFGTGFFELDEFETLQPLLVESKFGLQIQSHKKILEALFFQLTAADKLQRFVLTMQILQCMGQAKRSQLSNFIYPKNYTDTEGKRMSDVIEFTMRYYTEDINLQQIAKIAHLTPNAFCKYFKQRTDKTYFQFLTELRIAYACKLLLKHKDLSVVQVAYQSGFKNISNFNRQFKRLQKSTPLHYRNA